MEIARESLDDLLAEVYPLILTEGICNPESSKGPNLDLIGVTLRLANPRARLSRSRGRGRPFSALGELLWYLAGSDETAFIAEYIPSYYRKKGYPPKVPDAYGPRLRGSLPEKGFGNDQIETVVAALKAKPGTRHAIIQLFDSTDLGSDGDVPCTTALQFHVREGRLHMTVTMRSNDAYLGLPHDLFCFTMLQEMIATHLGLELGEYVHFASSLHIYTDKADDAKAYLDEGFHRAAPMPSMPASDPFEAFAELLRLEEKIRLRREPVDFAALGFEPYYEDLARIIFAHFHRREDAELEVALDGLHHREYHTYIDARRSTGKRAAGGDKAR